MNNRLEVKNNQMINASLLFFVILGAQIGVGVHGFQSIVYDSAKQDSWIAVILSFMFAHVVAFIMIKTLAMYGGTNDLYGIHVDIYGKFIGNFLNLIYIFYCTFSFFVIIKNYIEVIVTWVFPQIYPQFLYATLIIIVIYAFTGGLRVIVGVCFFSFFFSFWVLPTLLFILPYANNNHLVPLLNDLMGIIKGTYAMTFTIVGFEIIYTLYPYVKEKKKVQKFVHLGLFGTLLGYLLLMLLAQSFFSGQQLTKTIWPTLSMFSIVRLPFFERIEIFTICSWMLIILPNLCLFIWASYRGMLRMVKISPSKYAWIFSILILVATFFIKSRAEINMMNNYFAKFAFFTVFIYPFVLFLLAWLKKKITKSKQQVKQP
ncbi:GerAB/ArcD/ProY family transporter [Ureibacillus sp. NPDC094379]